MFLFCSFFGFVVYFSSSFLLSLTLFIVVWYLCTLFGIFSVFFMLFCCCPVCQRFLLALQFPGDAGCCTLGIRYIIFIIVADNINAIILIWLLRVWLSLVGFGWVWFGWVWFGLSLVVDVLSSKSPAIVHHHKTIFTKC